MPANATVQQPRTHSVDDPLPARLTLRIGAGALAEPFLVQLTHGGRLYDVDAPLPTITTAKRGETGIAQPYLMKYCSTGGARSVDEPVDTITTKDRFGLVMPVIDGYALDIRFRMLQPRELARAMGFDDEYVFEGNREQVVKQIGNAVAVNTARALCQAVLA
jgi:DNA (cytosine-5)-methyltransferase 1